MIVDSTALPEQAVRDILASAFTSAGPAMPMVKVLRTITPKSDRPAMLDGLAKPEPIIAATIGTQPERSTSGWNVEDTAAKCRLSNPSWMRWPPPSSSTM